jgi:hypothetical protein
MIILQFESSDGKPIFILVKVGPMIFMGDAS